MGSQCLLDRHCLVVLRGETLLSANGTSIDVFCMDDYPSCSNTIQVFQNRPEDSLEQINISNITGIEAISRGDNEIILVRNFYQFALIHREQLESATNTFLRNQICTFTYEEEDIIELKIFKKLLIVCTNFFCDVMEIHLSESRITTSTTARFSFEKVFTDVLSFDYNGDVNLLLCSPGTSVYSVNILKTIDDDEFKVMNAAKFVLVSDDTLTSNIKTTKRILRFDNILFILFGKRILLYTDTGKMPVTISEQQIRYVSSSLSSGDQCDLSVIYFETDNVWVAEMMMTPGKSTLMRKDRICFPSAGCVRGVANRGRIKLKDNKSWATKMVIGGEGGFLLEIVASACVSSDRYERTNRKIAFLYPLKDRVVFIAHDGLVFYDDPTVSDSSSYRSVQMTNHEISICIDDLDKSNHLYLPYKYSSINYLISVVPKRCCFVSVENAKLRYAMCYPPSYVPNKYPWVGVLDNHFLLYDLNTLLITDYRFEDCVVSYLDPSLDVKSPIFVRRIEQDSDWFIVVIANKSSVHIGVYDKRLSGSVYTLGNPQPIKVFDVFPSFYRTRNRTEIVDFLLLPNRLMYLLGKDGLLYEMELVEGERSGEDLGKCQCALGPNLKPALKRIRNLWRNAEATPIEICHFDGRVYALFMELFTAKTRVILIDVLDGIPVVDHWVEEKFVISKQAQFAVTFCDKKKAMNLLNIVNERVSITTIDFREYTLLDRGIGCMNTIQDVTSQKIDEMQTLVVFTSHSITTSVYNHEKRSISQLSEFFMPFECCYPRISMLGKDAVLVVSARGRLISFYFELKTDDRGVLVETNITSTHCQFVSSVNAEKKGVDNAIVRSVIGSITDSANGTITPHMMTEEICNGSQLFFTFSTNIVPVVDRDKWKIAKVFKKCAGPFAMGMTNGASMEDTFSCVVSHDNDKLLYIQTSHKLYTINCPAQPVILTDVCFLNSCGFFCVSNQVGQVFLIVITRRSPGSKEHSVFSTKLPFEVISDRKENYGSAEQCRKDFTLKMKGRRGVKFGEQKKTTRLTKKSLDLMANKSRLLSDRRLTVLKCQSETVAKDEFRVTIHRHLTDSYHISKVTAMVRLCYQESEVTGCEVEISTERKLYVGSATDYGIYEPVSNAIVVCDKGVVVHRWCPNEELKWGKPLMMRKCEQISEPTESWSERVGLKGENKPS